MNPTPADVTWRRIAIGTFVTLLIVAVAWNGAAFVIDASALPDGGAWIGMSTISMLGTMFFGSPAFLMCLIAADAANRFPDDARRCAWLAAGVAVVCSGGLLWLWPNIQGSPTDAAFAIVSLFLALVLLGPLVLCIRHYRSERA